VVRTHDDHPLVPPPEHGPAARLCGTPAGAQHIGHAEAEEKVLAGAAHMLQAARLDSSSRSR
jgi:hypothetical protein